MRILEAEERVPEGVDTGGRRRSTCPGGCGWRCG
jgi:hypothetical protein